MNILYANMYNLSLRHSLYYARPFSSRNNINDDTISI